MSKVRMYAVINDWTNIEVILARSELEAVKAVLKNDNVVQLSDKQIDVDKVNIEAMCHAITEKSARIFDYKMPHSDLVSDAFNYEATAYYGFPIAS
jgi:hypothetical protein